MSAENVEGMRRFYETLNRALATGEVPLALIRQADPEIVIDMGALEGTFHGQEGIRQFIEGQLSIINDLQCEPEEIIEAGDRIVVPAHLTGRARNTQLPFDYHTVRVWTVRNGRAVDLRLHASKSQALKAVGLEE